MIFFRKTNIWFLVLLIFVMIGCNSLDNVRESRWKYVEGYHIGDLLNFTHIQQFKLDDKGNLYIKNEHKGKIVNYTSTELVIESNDGQKGFYNVFN